MKKPLQLLTIFSILLLNFIISSSFSAVEVGSAASPPPVEIKKSRKALHLEKRYQRLKKRLKRTKHDKTRVRLQHRLSTVTAQQNNGEEPTPIIGMIGMSLGVLSFIMMTLFIYSWATANTMAFVGGVLVISAFTGATILGLLTILLAIAGLVISIISLSKIKRNPEKHNLKGFGVTGIVISSVVLGLMLLLYTGFLAYISSL